MSKLAHMSKTGFFHLKISKVKIISFSMPMYTGRLMVRVHNAYAEVYNWSRTSSKTTLKIAYNQSAMGFSLCNLVWVVRKYILKSGSHCGENMAKTNFKVC